jgi:Cd2+/Zn2+-exporting ATPase
MAHTHTHDHDHHGHHRHDHDAEECCTIEQGPEARASARDGRSFKVRGLDCAEEVAVLKKAVGPVVGGTDRLAFDVLNGRMTVLKTALSVPPEDILKAVAATGMQAEPWSTSSAEGDADHRQQQLWFTVASGVAVLVGMASHVFSSENFPAALHLFFDHTAQATPWFEIAAYVVAAVLGARFVAVKAWYAARNLRPDMNLLMIVAVLGAMVIGEWFEGATVAFLFALSLALEGWSVGRARRAIASLLDIAPPTARVLRDDGTQSEVPVAEIRPGSRFVVPGGERIALDGRVLSGQSAVNQAPITGESVPVEKHAGAEVYAGTINGDGLLTVEAIKAVDDTALARIIRMVEEAHARRAPSERWVERFARVYTPAVMVLALLIFLVPPLVFGQGWEVWFYRALVLLVIGCPCALVISTPVSIVAALASAARAGVLVKGGAFIELPAQLKAIAMDKTGTVTRGEPEVVNVIPLSEHSEQDLLARAAALEAHSTHPLARAILRYAESQGMSIAPAQDVQVLRGKGLAGTSKGSPFWLGSHRYVVERGQSTPETKRRADELESDGKTVIVVGNERHVCGLIAVADPVRPQARQLVEELHAAGIRQVVMLTGDNRVTAEAIGREAGMDKVHAELLPEDKVHRIEELAREYGTVAMVGDGINDAPALARADLGIAMGAIGSDAAIETADVALMTDDVSRLPWLVRHAKRTLRVIRQNIAFALGVKILFFALTFAGMATLWGAIAADVGASLLVVLNALRLLHPGDAAVFRQP